MRSAWRWAEPPALQPARHSERRRGEPVDEVQSVWSVHRAGRMVRPPYASYPHRRHRLR